MYIIKMFGWAWDDHLTAMLHPSPGLGGVQWVQTPPDEQKYGTSSRPVQSNLKHEGGGEDLIFAVYVCGQL